MLLWKIDNENLKIASIRYRCLTPHLQLQKLGYNSIIFSNKDENIPLTNDIKTLIFVKSFEVNDLILAQKAHQKKIPIILDICDNIFLPTYHDHKKIRMDEVFMEMTVLSSAIVASTPPIAALIKTKVSNPEQVMVIPDTAIDLNITKKIFAAHSRARIRKWVYVAKNKYLSNQLVANLRYLIHRLSKINKKAVLNKMVSRGQTLFKSLFNYDVGYLKNYFQQFRRQPDKTLEKSIFDIRIYLQRDFPVLHSILRKIKRGPQRLRKTEEPEENKKLDPFSLKTNSLSKRNFKRITWFGNHGAKHSEFGMKDILIIEEQLIEISKIYDIELLVISNNSAKFKKHIARLPFPTQYYEWDPIRVYHWLADSDVAIIPNPLNDFTICKSANRAVTALNLGTPVLATRTPTLEIFKDCIIMDNWLEGFNIYFSSPKITQQHLNTARKIIKKELSIERTGENWTNILNLVISQTKPQQFEQAQTPYNEEAKKVIGFFIGLVQDLDVLLPLILNARNKRCLKPKVFVNEVVLKKSGRIWFTLLKHQLEFQILTNFELIWGKQPILSDLDAFVTGAETSQNVHRAAHVLTHRANALRIPTFTLQHGFENIGLTYSDEEHPIHSIKIESHNILIWGKMETLHPKAPKDIRERCHPIGILKPIDNSLTNIKTLENSKPVIGIFENLHWKRYNQDYIDYFLNDLQHIIQKYLNLTFILKPHPAGLWFSKNQNGIFTQYKNFILADPNIKEWSKFSAKEILQDCLAVITTPSTIAMDAARMGKPVAVIGYNLDLDHYSPLPIIKNISDWSEFLSSSQDSNKTHCFKQYSSTFVDNYSVPGDSLEKALNLIDSKYKEIAH